MGRINIHRENKKRKKRGAVCRTLGPPQRHGSVKSTLGFFNIVPSAEKKIQKQR